MSNENNNNNINSKDFLIGTFIGGFLGAAAALLFAPKSGKELRQDLNHQADNVRTKTGELRDTAVEKGTVIAGVAKERTEQIKKVVSEQSVGLKEKAKSWKEYKKSCDEAVAIEDEELTDTIVEIDQEESTAPVSQLEDEVIEIENIEEKEIQPTNV
ncbi:YtxH domain-containing protein [Bacillus solimangrovi]|uniref:General stress protein n=1 Tax=Bacillus solimangrovi TaxID=1305675 RepID=A0A1E5LCJ9_9BACI|nr:YtxH domain-containing protein [Bacillus solimangrovi]OEH91791.1 hypothetical protein BFG57_03365 [Bacillus solimangrovi]